MKIEYDNLYATVNLEAKEIVELKFVPTKYWYSGKDRETLIEANRLQGYFDLGLIERLSHLGEFRAGGIKFEINPAKLYIVDMTKSREHYLP